MTERFDVIIVGAGLAGLSSAYALDKRSKRVLVLEAGNHVGGKVMTRHWENMPYECGALFAFDPSWVFFPVQAGPLFTSNHPVGVFADGRLIKGDSVVACLNAMGLDTRATLLLKEFFQSESPQPELVGADCRAVLNAFFQVIHPGDIAAYVPSRRRDSLVRHAVSYFADGNESLVKAYLANTRAEIRIGCPVTRLCSENDCVTVRWRSDRGEHFSAADWVVLATPAAEAKALAARQDNIATRFLARVRYGNGISVTLGLRHTSLQPFSYIVLPESPMNTLIFRDSGDGSNAIFLTAYLVGEKADTYWDASDTELAELARAELNRLNIGDVTADDILFSDACRWPGVGPIISAETYESFSQACLLPADRVVLAGDYTWWNSQHMPYGMQAAIASGSRAADMILNGTARTSASQFHPEPLATSLTTVLTEQGPKVKGTVEDGTIAYYGLVLRSRPDTHLERYLVGEAEDGLWSYQYGYGVTSLDSALVMEALLENGRHGQLLSHSADRIVTEFFDGEEGGFRTIPHSRQGRAPYWLGTDCPATAYCAWLLARIAPERHGAVIRACAEYLRRKQHISGSWPGKWFPSETIPIYYAVRLLAPMGAEFVKSCERARLWLWGKQRKDGSWQGSVIETAAAILALDVLGESTEQTRKGCDWIHGCAVGSNWAGEPILQYWFEEDGRKMLFTTHDKGRVTTAWATIALQKAGGLLAA